MLVHRATRAPGATGPSRDPARGGGRVRHRGGADRGAGGQGTYTRGGEGTQPKEEAVSDTGETAEGPGDKVRTPREWRHPAQEGSHVRHGEGPGNKVRTPGEGRELSPRRRPCPTLGRG